LSKRFPFAIYYEIQRLADNLAKTRLVILFSTHLGCSPKSTQFLFGVKQRVKLTRVGGKTDGMDTAHP
jgi:hypothetical protein